MLEIDVDKAEVNCGLVKALVTKLSSIVPENSEGTLKYPPLDI